MFIVKFIVTHTIPRQTDSPQELDLSDWPSCPLPLRPRELLLRRVNWPIDRSGVCPPPPLFFAHERRWTVHPIGKTRIPADPCRFIGTQKRRLLFVLTKLHILQRPKGPNGQLDSLVASNYNLWLLRPRSTMLPCPRIEPDPSSVQGPPLAGEPSDSPQDASLVSDRLALLLELVHG